MKSEVYSWRVSPEVKTSLEREALRRNISVSAALDEAAREWVQRSSTANESDEEQQLRLHEAASKWLGKLSSGDSRRSETVSEQVRDRLRRRYGR